MDHDAILEYTDLSQLLSALHGRGYTVIGPTLRDGAIVYDEVETVVDLPLGYTDVQDAGTYRVARRTDDAVFGYAVGPHSYKQFLHPAVVSLWEATRTDGEMTIRTPPASGVKYAFVGARSCELHAIAIQDRVLYQGAYADPIYATVRESLFVVAVNCAHAGGTCFCVSMGTGPRATSGFDLSLTEVQGEGTHYFVVEVGSEHGAEILDQVPHRAASADESAAAERVVAEAAGQMRRTLDTDGLRDLLYRNLEHPRWEEIERRCLSCGNCTLVCPTCFCTTVNDVTDLSGQHAERVRTWDSCFTADFSYIHGGSVRTSVRSRYRQWMTHKLASWIDQFGTAGCVGCGRCVSWCPVGIDITEEVREIRRADGALSAQP